MCFGNGRGWWLSCVFAAKFAVTWLAARSPPEDLPVMMTQMIKAHNEVNGLVFSIVEFGLISLPVFPFAFYYLTHGRVVAGLIATGIIGNCLVVIVAAARALRRGEASIGVLKWLDKAGRARIFAFYPRIARDSLILTAAILVPFAVLVCVLGEAVLQPPQRP